MIGVEVLDDPAADPALVRAQLAELSILNRWFGGAAAVTGALLPLLPRAGSVCTLLDVGTGAGDIPRAVTRAAARRGVRVVAFGLDRLPPATQVARNGGLPMILGDGAALPVGSKSVDFVVASQVLHHLDANVATRWIAELDRVARRAVVIADLRRSWLAMAALWAASFPLRLHPTTRHDGVLSLRRGYTASELETLLGTAAVNTRVQRRRISRLVAVWMPTRISPSILRDAGGRLQPPPGTR